MGKRARVDRRVLRGCRHHWHDHGGPGGLHVWCCHCGAGAELAGEGAGLRVRFFGEGDPPADLVALVDGLTRPRPRAG